MSSWHKSTIDRIYEDARDVRFEFSERLLLRHCLILGASGSGKTNHTFHLIEEVFEKQKGVKCFIIDVKREYRKLAQVLGSKVQILAIGEEPAVKFNPLAPPRGVTNQLWDRAFADIFTRAYGLSEPSRRIILDCLAHLRRKLTGHPTLRELQEQVASFEVKSSREENSRRSLESRLHIVNMDPLGLALNSDDVLDPDSFSRVTVFEVGRINSIRDQHFLAELLLMQMWEYDRSRVASEDDWNEAEEERLKRLIVVEEAHRYLSEERPPEQRGDRTLLELAVAEARRYGWGFVVVDQMPTLLSRYVWDNMGTVLAHRLSNMSAYNRVKDAIGVPISQMVDDINNPIALRLPEDLAMFRKYASSPDEETIGVVKVSKIWKSEINRWSDGGREMR